MIYLQHTLRANHIPRTNLPRSSPRTSSPDRNRQRLESALGTVVVVVAVRAANMQGHICRLCKALQTVGDHLSAEIPNLLALQAQVDYRPRPAREIDHSPRKGLIEGGVAASESGQRLPRTQGFCEGCAYGEEGVFCCVVIVNWVEKLVAYSVLEIIAPE